MKNLLEIKIPPVKDFISVARYTAAIYANSVGFDIEKIEDIKLVVGEACNNAVLYGDTRENNILIKFYTAEDSMQIDIVDKGYGFDIDSHKNPNLDNPEEGGFGIFIIKELSDYLKIESSKDEGTHLNIRFNLV